MIFLSKIRSSNLACFMTCYRLRMSYFCLQLTTATSGIFSIIFVIRGTSGVEQLRNTSIHLKREIKNAILIDAFYYKFAKSERASTSEELIDFSRGVASLFPCVLCAPCVPCVPMWHEDSLFTPDEVGVQVQIPVWLLPDFFCFAFLLFLFKSQRGYFQIFFVSHFCFMVFLPFGLSPFILITDSF